MKVLWTLVLLLVSTIASTNDFFEVNPPYDEVEKAYIGSRIIKGSYASDEHFLYLKEFGSMVFYNFPIEIYARSAELINFYLLSKPEIGLKAYIKNH